MPTRNSYYPARIGDQIVWLRNFSNKIANYEVLFGYQAPEITTVQGDADRIVYLLETVQAAAQSFAQAITSHIGLVQDGTGAAVVDLPVFALPGTPPSPANVLPGALRRIFAFVANLKTRPAFTSDIGEDLQVIGSIATPAPNAAPPCSAEVRGGEVVVSFKKMGHMGVWVEGQVAADTAWTFLAIDTTNPYNDSRPLKVAGQPEKRRYRLCFWDGDPTQVWSPVIEVVFGG